MIEVLLQHSLLVRLFLFCLFVVVVFKRSVCQEDFACLFLCVCSFVVVVSTPGKYFTLGFHYTTNPCSSSDLLCVIDLRFMPVCLLLPSLFREKGLSTGPCERMFCFVRLRRIRLLPPVLNQIQLYRGGKRVNCSRID